MGLAETHQTLLLNGLRDRMVVQADGGLRTGRDVLIAAMLGADEFGFATAPLIAAGCIMMRKCHLNTCPVGIATQDPVLRARFTGTPEHVVNYLFFVAEEVRELLASLGLRTLGDAVGRSDLLSQSMAGEGHWKASGIDVAKLLFRPDAPAPIGEHLGHASPMRIDEQIIAALDQPLPIRLDLRIGNDDRSVGGRVSGDLVRKMGAERMPDGSLDVTLRGSAGQSLGAFLIAGITLDVIGDANDYAGKGLSGGRIIVRQPDGAPRNAADNIIVGNTCLYGATGGEAFFGGMAGERFAVRNSGATAVVEGIGDHGCEYMTGGTVVVLGRIGRNFAAGMSGGIALVYDPRGELATKCNMTSVTLEPVEDAAALKALIEQHAVRTNSVRARELLDNWDKALGEFTLVMPIDYRRALEAQTRTLQDLAA